MPSNSVSGATESVFMRTSGSERRRHRLGLVLHRSHSRSSIRRSPQHPCFFFETEFIRMPQVITENYTPEMGVDSSQSLAVQRTFLAHERTLMAWVRTSASLISFGFTIYKFFAYLVETEGRTL